MPPSRRRVLRPLRSQLLARRDFLRLGAAGIALGLTPLTEGCLPTGTPAGGIEPSGPPKAPPEHWVRDARIAGFEVAVDAKPHELGAALDVLARSGVNVVEADSDLSSYLTDFAFEEQLEVLDLVAHGCHLRGMRCVVYYPTLEVLSPDAETSLVVMSKDHPDWLQIGIDGKKNMFIGGGGRVFWVDPGVESAWMCPLSGYTDYFLERVKRLVSTRIDGVWGDVPLLSDIEGVWPCTNDACRTKFRADTGLEIPSEVDWDDPAFRRWVAWRHQLIWDFERRFLDAVKSVNPKAEAIIETVTMDYNGGTIQGLDGAFADDGDLIRVWEVDAVSDATAMRGGTADDWICMAIMMRHGTGASFGRPSWMFTYGFNEEDAERVMALAVVTRNNPYETKIPLMCTTVGNTYRQRMYEWMDAQKDLYALPPQNRAAVLFSPQSRDYLDRNSGVGLYASLNDVDPLWWSSEEPDSALQMQYLADFRGTCKALIHAHVPFDVLPVAALGAQSLASYTFLAIPSALALSSKSIEAIGAFVAGGGTVLVSGSDGGGCDEYGVARAEPSLLRALDITAAGWSTRQKGSGTVVHSADRAGRAYFQSNDPALLAQFASAAGGAKIVTTAPKEVLFDLRRGDNGGIVLVCANLFGLGAEGIGKYTAKDATFRVSLPDQGKAPRKVSLSEPTVGSADREIGFTHEAGLVSFELTVHALIVARITLA